MKLSILEQSTLPENASASQAIANTVTLAREADRLGYERIWLSEHHNMSILQGSSPEVLLASIGAQTQRIRIGSGGVMLPNHSAYRVAENFRTLEALYPGRVDCGIGRASGEDMYARSLLNPVAATAEDFVEQVDQLDRYFHDECKRALAMPTVESVPPMWLLSAGSHPGSGALAAEKGMGLAVALFINPDASAEAVQVYREQFKPSAEFPESKVVIALNVVCAETRDKLDELKKASDYFRLMRDSGRYPRSVPSSATLAEINFGDEAEDYLRRIANREVTGTPSEVREKILERAQAYNADEVMLAMMTNRLDDKIETIRLLAQVFGVVP
ncbi:LLM class flavin-dependent oxidoreductase [Paraburkholderia sp. BCC1884]|uniref:LLM class flavin-dependent oxidoreductase n=1 Tax=Paraburkholderia sp. BCC1884 TaxID=2562668 RepID=UPI001181FC54|nr:LLM class flavin-dependent oxidoreductase [Paraburkholderia sp. BCC1884]